MVGIAEIQPEAERFFGRFLSEELAHLLDGRGVGTGAQIIYALLKRSQAVLGEEAGAGRAVGGVGAVEVIGPAADAGEITRLRAEDFGKRDFVAGERGGEARHARGDGGTAREVTGAGGHALGCDCKQAVELHALGGEFIKGGRADVGVAVAAQERVAVVVGEDEENVGLRRRGRAEEAGGEREKQGKDGDVEDHGAGRWGD